MKKYYLLFITIGLLSCNQPGKSPESEATNNDRPNTITRECFAYTNGDSILLQMERKGDAVEGTLVYAWKEKDANKGTIKGAWRGDTLVAVYTFQSEGTTSSRPVLFLRKDSTLVEGFGPVNNQDSSLLTPSLRFHTGFELRRTECQ